MLKAAHLLDVPLWFAVLLPEAPKQDIINLTPLIL